MAANEWPMQPKVTAWLGDSKKNTKLKGILKFDAIKYAINSPVIVNSLTEAVINWSHLYKKIILMHPQFCDAVASIRLDPV